MPNPAPQHPSHDVSAKEPQTSCPRCGTWSSTDRCPQCGAHRKSIEIITQSSEEPSSEDTREGGT